VSIGGYIEDHRQGLSCWPVPSSNMKPSCPSCSTCSCLLIILKIAWERFLVASCVDVSASFFFSFPVYLLVQFPHP
jgi:hypothetical protein